MKHSRLFVAAFFCVFGTLLSCGSSTPYFAPTAPYSANTCSGGAYLGSDGQCYCPDGSQWDGHSCLTVATTCTGGAYLASDGQCYCPDGSQWDGSSCVVVATCTGGAFLGNDGQCYCPDGSQWDGYSCVAVATCSGGAFVGNDGQCYCPNGTQWDGVYCSTVTTTSVQDLCYDLDCNGDRTGRQCFDNRAAYCASLCSSTNCLAPAACERNCR